jgi:hypothetical protein
MRKDVVAGPCHQVLSCAWRVSVGLSIRVHSLMLSVQYLACLFLRLSVSTVPWGDFFGNWVVVHDVQTMSVSSSLLL